MILRPFSIPSFSSTTIVWLFVLAAALFGIPDIAMAEANLPYEGGLTKFQESLEGPVPFAISLVGIVACGAMLIFGGEISGFMRTMVFLVLVISIIVQAGNIVELMGGKRPPATSYVRPQIASWPGTIG